MTLKYDADRCKYLDDGTITKLTKGRITPLRFKIIIILVIPMFAMISPRRDNVYLAQLNNKYICHFSWSIHAKRNVENS